MTLRYLPWVGPADAQASAPTTADTGTTVLADAALRLTDTEVADRVDAVAEHLAGLGVTRGDVVAVMLPNRVELVLTLLAAWRLGAAATPVNPAFTDAEAGYQLADSGAVLVVTAAGRSLPGIRSLDVDVLGALTRPAAELPPPATGLEHEIALVVYTSGSTGRPKGVLLDHANLAANIDMMIDRVGLTSADHALLVLPLFHVNAVLVSFLSMRVVGGRLTILDRFEPASFLRAVEIHRPTYFSAVPAIFARLLEVPAAADTSSLRFAICGAAPVSPELLAAAESRFGLTLVEGYGLTEGTCASACNPVDGVRKLGTVGPALTGQQFAIAGPDGARLPAGQDGEVLISGPTVMRGYLGLPEATAETVVDGWLRTGDVGRLDEDGYLTLVDRIKDMIIRGGENLYPKEIESVLCAHPGVLEAAVVGAPHEVLGEVPVAYVVAFPDATVTAEELLAHCRAQLTRVKLPTAISVVDALPRNPVGKVDKPALRRGLAAALTPDPAVEPPVPEPPAVHQPVPA